MSNYSTSNGLVGTRQAITTTFTTQLILSAQVTTPIRGTLTDIAFGPTGVPNATDCEIIYDLSRSTTLGTGTTAVPVAVDPAFSAASSVGTVNQTVEPTITAVSILYNVALNQRNTLHVFFSTPGLIWPATALNGIAFRSLSPNYAATIGVDAFHQE